MKKRNIVIIIAVLVLDLVSKQIISSDISMHGHIEVIKNFFYITYAKNTGAAWSLFEGKTWILTIVSAIGAALFIYLLIKCKKEDNLGQWAFALIVGGTVGNLIDRLLLGYVRDFLDFYIFGYDFPIFNIADSALCIGVALLFIKVIFFDKDEKNGNKIA